MNRLTKPLARLGTLAVIAGTVLGTPLALGTASAATAPSVTIDNGTVTFSDTAPASDSARDGFVDVTATNGSGTTEVQLTSGNGYFVEIGDQPDAAGCGTLTIVNSVDATFTGAGDCSIEVGDASADSIAVKVINHGANTETDKALNFSGLFWSGCQQSGINGEGSGDGTNRCRTQGQSAHVLTVSVHYLAGGAGFGAQNLEADLTAGSGQFAGAQPAGTSYVSTTDAKCSTDSTGNCSFNIVDNSPTAETQHPVTLDSNHITIETLGSTGTVGSGGYPNLTTTPLPQETIQEVVTSVTSARLDLVSSTLIAPTTQDVTSSDAEEAEPGDVIQNTYRLYGGCTQPSNPALSCTGESLAGTSVALTVNHGFFTPNCSSGAPITGAPGHNPPSLSDNNYANCTFTTAPTVGGVVGNISSTLGQSTTATTDGNGYIVVSLGIARDAAFDNDGYVVAAVTGNGLHPRIPGISSTYDYNPNGANCADSDGVSQPEIDSSSTPANTKLYDDGTLHPYPHKGCFLDTEWTTDEQPLNGGKATLVAIPRLTNPTNAFFNSENNYTATDTGTNNIPDVGRVVYLVHITDQFGNLTSNEDADDPNATVLSKTGVGSIWACVPNLSPVDDEQDFTSTNPCLGDDDYFDATGQNADGTIDQSDDIDGSYLDGPSQQRFQSDAAPTEADLQNGCYAPSGANLLGLPTGLCDVSLISLLGGGFDEETPGQNFIGVDDGTQTVTLDWTAPTTTFKTYNGPSASFGASATYAAGNLADAPDSYKLNIYNQLSAPVVTFAATPGGSVPTSTAVTVTGTVVDQFGNGIVDNTVTFVRSGGNEASCTPIQNSTNAVEATNQAGVAGYTFSCDAAGVSNVSIVVEGPGGTQLASGKEAVTFTGNASKVVTELPTITVSSPSAGHLTVHIVTHPAVAHTRINIYRKSNGLYHLLGSVKTGHLGHAVKHLAGLHRGVKYHIAAKAVGLGAGYSEKYSKHKTITIKA